MDSSFLQKVTHIVTFCRNELLFNWLQKYLFSMKYTSFWKEMFYTTQVPFVSYFREGNFNKK